MALTKFLSAKTAAAVLLVTLMNLGSNPPTADTTAMIAAQVTATAVGSLIVVYILWWVAYVWYPSDEETAAT